MAHLTRHELKQDEFRSTFERFEQFVKERANEVLAAGGILVVVVGLGAGLKLYNDRQEAEANALLGAALKTFRAYVGVVAPGTLGPDAETFSTAREKYKKALDQFREINVKFPRMKAAAIARYHAGVCQANLGDQTGAMRTLEEVGRSSDRSIASLARLALAGELAKSGKLDEAGKIYQDLADHPTPTVPRATALLEMADAYRSVRREQARLIYERIEKEFSSDAALVQAVKQQAESLSK